MLTESTVCVEVAAYEMSLRPDCEAATPACLHAMSTCTWSSRILFTSATQHHASRTLDFIRRSALQPSNPSHSLACRVGF